jgi:hypothetical protein
MMKLADLLELNMQPGEIPKMKNFLNRGSRDQVDLYPNRYNVVGSKPGVIGQEEGMLDTSNHPEDHNSSQRCNNGYPWSFDDPSGIFEEDSDERVHQSLIGREFQTLDDLAKMASRLRQTGFAQSEIEEFVKKYLI